MTQLHRRMIFWGAVATLLILGVILQARADDTAALNGSVQRATLKSDRDGEIATEEEALLQELSCAISVIALQLPLAKKECERAIALSPQDPTGFKYRGIAYLLEHRFERAEADMKEAVRLDPEDSDSQAGYAQALNGQGRFSEAVARFGVALKLAPNDVRYLSARCWARGGEGKDFPAALRDCNLAIRLDPAYAVAFDSRAFIYLRLARHAQAIKDYSTSLRLQPERATALFGRGLAELHSGQTATASADIRQARRIDPEIDDVYILANVLQEGCRTEHGSCDLPLGLRNSFGAKTYLSVSYRKSAP